MKDKGATIFCCLDIALDPVAELDCRFKGGGTVFQHTIAVQPAMSIGLAFQKHYAVRRRSRHECIV
jgi:hypothetical protein